MRMDAALAIRSAFTKTKGPLRVEPQGSSVPKLDLTSILALVLTALGLFSTSSCLGLGLPAIAQPLPGTQRQPS